jgi:hypothetical protein
MDKNREKIACVIGGSVALRRFDYRRNCRSNHRRGDGDYSLPAYIIIVEKAAVINAFKG